MYEASKIAQYVVMRCNQDRISISNLKLQKILYFIQAQFLIAKNEVCFLDKIEAWDFGPVVPNVYHRYKVFGSANIPSNGDRVPCFNGDDKELIDSVIDLCAKYTASQLVAITHNQKPWREVYNRYYKAEISPDSIRDYFAEA